MSAASSVSFVASSGDDAVTFMPLVVLQVDGRAVFHDDDNAVEGESGFTAPRVRLGGRLKWRAFEAQLIGEGAREKAGVLEAFGTVHLADEFAVTVGLQRSPLFAGGPDPLTFQPINERGVLERTMWPGRELGVGVRWSPTYVPVQAWLRVSNGVENALLGNDNSGFAGEGRVDFACGNARASRSYNQARDNNDDDGGFRAGFSARIESTDNESGMSGATPLNYVYWRAPPVSGPSSTIELHAQAFVGPARLTIEGGVANESRATDNDGNPNTPKVLTTGVMHSGGNAELAAVIVGPRRVWGTAPKTASLTTPVIELAARGEVVRLGDAPFGETADPAVIAGGAQAASAALTWWSHESLSLSLQVHALKYDVAPVDDPNRTSSLTAMLRLTVVAL